MLTCRAQRPKANTSMLTWEKHPQTKITSIGWIPILNCGDARATKGSVWPATAQSEVQVIGQHQTSGVDRETPKTLIRMKKSDSYYIRAGTSQFLAVSYFKTHSITSIQTCPWFDLFCLPPPSSLHVGNAVWPLAKCSHPKRSTSWATSIPLETHQLCL